MMILWLRTIRAALWITMLAIGIVSCGGDEADTPGGRLRIVTTTGMIEDAVREIASDRATVTSLMGPGVDPHLYKATQGDLSRLTSADIVFYNGLHLEGKMVEALEHLGRTRNVIAVTDGIPRGQLRRPADFNGNYDPHVWFDVRLWSMAVRLIGDSLASVDTVNARYYRDRTDAYVHRLDSLDSWVRTQIASISQSGRVLITAHDAFGYFGRAYAIDVRGLQGISTVSEFGLADLGALVDTIVARRVKAVFLETSVPRRSIEALVEGVRAKGHDVSVGGSLYSDAMGEKGSPEGTYIGMVTANVRTIVGALR